MILFEKNLEIFQNCKIWQIFSRMHLKWYHFLQLSFHLIFEVFLAKIQKKFKVGKIRIYDEQKGYFEEKNAFIVLKGILNNVGAKFPRDSRVSSFEFSLCRLYRKITDASAYLYDHYSTTCFHIRYQSLHFYEINLVRGVGTLK